MTMDPREEEWLIGKDPTRLLGLLPMASVKAGDRKFQLFACACVRRTKGIPTYEWYRERLDEFERSHLAPTHQDGWRALAEMVKAMKIRLVWNQDFETAGHLRNI